MKKRTVLALGTALILSLLVIGAVLALGTPAINWWVISGGGAPASGGDIRLNDTLGQPIAGLSSNGNLALMSGYWYGPAVVTDETRCGVTAGNTYTFNATWQVQVGVDSLGTIHCLRVRLTDSNHIYATTELQTGRYWTLTAEDSLGNPASSYNLTLTLPAGFTPTNQDKVCRYSGSGLVWDCAQSSYNATANTVTRSNITQLSDWAVGANAGPILAIGNIYTETFITYTNKDYTDNTVWDVWAHQLRMRRSDAKSTAINPTCAMNMAGSDEVVVVWRGDKTNSRWIYAQRLDSQGNRLWEQDVRVNKETINAVCPSVDVDANGNAVVAWSMVDLDTGEFDIFAQMLDPDGNKLWPEEVRVSQTPEVEQRQNPTARFGPDGNIWVAWWVHLSGNYAEVYAQKLDRSGVLLLANDARVNAEEVRLPTGDGPYTIDMSVGVNGYATVVWMDQRNGDPSVYSNNVDVYAQRLASDGSRQWATDLRVNSDTGTDNQVFPAVAVNSTGESIVAWSGDSTWGGNNCMAQKLDTGGTKLWGGGVRLSTRYLQTLAVDLDSTGNAIIAGMSGSVVVVQKVGTDGSLPWGIYGKVLYTENTLTLTDGRIVVDSQNRAFVAWVAYNWFGSSNVRIQQVDSAGDARWGAVEWVNSDNGRASQTKPALAVTLSGVSFLAWKDNRHGTDDVYAQVLGSDGGRNWESDIRVNTLASGAITYPPAAVLVDDQSVLVFWVQNGGVYVQRLDLNGNKLWPAEITLNTVGTADRVDAARLDATGNVLVVWKSGSTLYAQKVDPQGQKLWPADVLVTSGADQPIVAANGAGTGVVSWEVYQTSGWLLYAQKLDANGVLGWTTPIQVNTNDPVLSSPPGLAVDPLGNSYFEWIALQDNSFITITLTVQKLDTSGVKLWNAGTDMPVTHSLSPFYEDDLDITLDSGGNSYISYITGYYGPCGINPCIQVQQLDASGNKGWLIDTAVTSDSQYQQHNANLAVDDTGDIYLAWQDEHNGNWDIYANKLYTDGTSAWITYTQVILPDSFYLLSGAVQSLKVNTVDQNIHSATLTADYELNSGSLRFSLSNNGGVNWFPALPGVTQVFTTTGTDLRWHADLTADPLWPRAPVIHSLRIEYVFMPAGADDYEPDDTCDAARQIESGGKAQLHNFHQAADTDWVYFNAVSGSTYIIQAANPMTNTDAVVRLYSGCLSGGVTLLASADNPYGREARLTWQAPFSGVVFASVNNYTPALAGPETGYELSVRTAQQLPVAIIVVADVSTPTVQSHLDAAGDMAYRTFLETGMLKENILYFGPDPNRDVDGNGANDDIVGPPEPLAIRDAIQDWARQQGVRLGVPFYLVLVGDGSPGVFLAQGTLGVITTEGLNLWLSNLEATTGADNITVIIDSPKSGSFITAASTGQELVSSNILPATISKTNRVILTSTSNGMDTYLSTRGTYFSDSFFTALKQNADVKNSYLQALQAITKTGLNQQPWLDGNGDGIPDPVGSTRLSSAFQEVWSWPGAGTASAQGTVAPERGLGILDPHPAPVIDWVQIGEIAQGQATIQAQVRDDSGVRDVWMVIYPPDFVAPSPVSSGFPIVTVPTVTLTLSGTNLYTTLYSGFAEEGLYKIVVYAWDEDENQAVPVAESVLFVHDVYRVYLPMIQR